MALRRLASMRLGGVWGALTVCPSAGSRLITYSGLKFREVLRFAQETGELADAEHRAADRQPSNRFRSAISAHPG
jgi:hypothetical protein